MGVILDTSVLIAGERRRIDLEGFWETVGNEPVGISAITASELLHGCHRAVDLDIQARRFAFVEALLAAIPILEFGLAEARRHADVWTRLAREGIVVGAHHLIIGTTALARGYALATLNGSDFKRVPGLRLIPVEAFLT